LKRLKNAFSADSRRGPMGKENWEHSASLASAFIGKGNISKRK
jgi:hypothetical protein